MAVTEGRARGADSVTPSIASSPPPDLARGCPEDGLSFWDRAQANPAAAALVEQDGWRLTSGELLDLSQRMVSVLAQRGIGAGSCIAAVLPNDRWIVALALAALRSSLYLVPVNHHSTAAEIGYVLADSGAGAVIVDRRFPAAVEAALASGIGEANRFALQAGQDSLRTLPAELAESAPSRGGGRAGRLLMYTAGTTGRPSAVWRPLPPGAPEAEAVAEARRFHSRFAAIPTGERGPHLVLGPMYHAQPLVIGLHCLHSGQPLVLVDRWNSEEVLQILARERITSTALVPTMLERLQRLPADLRASHDLSALRRVMMAGAPCAPATKLGAIGWLGPVIDEYYASTEGGGTAISSEAWLQRQTSVGRPYPGAQLQILDESGHVVETGLSGRVYIRRQGDFQYLHDPVKTADRRLGDLFTVGDIGYLDSEGFLHLNDRDADVVIAGGVNIYPAEVEAALQAHPTVLDVAVIGVPDPEWGERVHALVELQAGAAPSPNLEAELIEFCARNLSPQKCPRSVEFVDRLPRSAAGKMQRRLLRDARWQGRERKI